MAIIVKTTRPEVLLTKIKKAIDVFDVESFGYTVEGAFIHMTFDTQLALEAFITPQVLDGEAIVFAVRGLAREELSKRAYAIYASRFFEMLMTHFGCDFSTVDVTALPYERLGDTE